MTFAATVLTLFPEMFPGPLGFSLAGRALEPDVLAAAIDAAPQVGPRLLMSPRGEPLTQALVRQLAAGPGLLIVCGRFEGVDERVIERRQLREISVGDYVLSGGEPAAIVLLDAIIRLLPGVMGKAESGAEESFEGGLLEHPHYTKPNIWARRPGLWKLHESGKI